jgi:hypothetical protein
VALKHAKAIELFRSIKCGEFNAENFHGDVDNHPRAADFHDLYAPHRACLKNETFF